MTQQDMDVYEKDAKPIVARFDDQMLTMLPKRFSTGSVGWYSNGKCKILVGDTYFPVQVSLTVTIIGSKNFACQKSPPDAPESTIPALLGPDYPYNRSGQEEANLEPQMASGDLKPDVEVNGKPHKPKKKGVKR